jgi:quercetin dioxygenase-like cupin family protein
MRLQTLVATILTIPLLSFVASPQSVPATTDGPRAAQILERQEGERRIHRPAGTSTGTAPFILKFDPQNGGAKHLVVFTEELPPGAAIPRHKHPNAEELVVLQTGRTRVHLGEIVKEVEAGATVFIPQDTWFSAEVIGDQPVSLVAVFSEPGYEEYMRAISVREGQPNSPMSKAELDVVRAQHPHAVNYK